MEAIMKTVILATSWAPLLSGRLDQCYNATDPTCSGGVASFRAMLRHEQKHQTITTNDDEDIPALHMQLLDKNNAFVHMHPLGLSVNRLILNDLMGLEVFASSPSLLLQNKYDYEVSQMDLSYLQSDDFPLLLTNVGVPPQNSWHQYTRAVHFDIDTGLAVLSVAKSDEQLNTPQIQSTVGSLRYIRKINEENGCLSSDDTITSTEEESKQCWLPVVYHSDDSNQFISFLLGMADLPKEHRPAMVIDTGGNFEEYTTPQLVDDMWISSIDMDTRTYFHHKMGISYDQNGSPKLDKVEFVSVPLSPLPDELKDETYQNEILALREEADIALKNNPVVGYSELMPVTRPSDKSYYRCKAGECPIGSLFTDAARWYAKADVAFITSGGVRGPGWPAGEVSVSNIWAGLPFPNSLCTGYMNGIHLFQLLNYSMSVSTFQGVDTDDGGRLLQVSGMKIVYNTDLDTSRVVSIDILDKETKKFEPLDRLKLYKFATDSYLCSAYDPYPVLLGSDTLVVEGEQPGKIEGVLFQEMLANFLNATTSDQAPYETTIQGRLVNDTSVAEAMNLIHTEETCSVGTYFDSSIQTCLSCPVSFDVEFGSQAIEFEVISQTDTNMDTITLKNHEEFDVAVVPKRLPAWLKLIGLDSDASPTSLGPHESLELSLEVDQSQLDQQGTFHFTVGFGVQDGGTYLHQCRAQSDITFDLTMKVYPNEQKNQLGSISAVGFSLFGIISCTSILFATFVFCNRQQQIVQKLQPIFLCTICFGSLVMGSVIVPLSLDDGNVQLKRCDIRCMSLPWLLCMGFSISMSALIAKLWRVNRVFGAAASCRRVVVRSRDVALPLVVLLLSNATVLLTWSLVDPLKWHRFAVDGYPYKTYGICTGSNSTPYVIVLCLLNVGALFLALFQAWKARGYGSEFSETKAVGLALYTWLQILLVGVPCLFLIDKHNTEPRYVLIVTLIFIVCMSMLLIIFLPLFIQIRRARLKQKVQMLDSSFRSQSNSSNKSPFRNPINSFVSQPSCSSVKNIDTQRVTFSGLVLGDGSNRLEIENCSSCNEREVSDGTISTLPVQSKCSIENEESPPTTVDDSCV